MSLSAVLQIGDNQSGTYIKEYLVVDCKYKFSRHINHNIHRTDSEARCGVIELSLIAPGKEDLSLHEWYIDRTILSGRIVFDISDQQVLQTQVGEKILLFEDAYCFAVAESYRINTSKRRVLKIEIVAETMNIATVEFGLNNI